ncbi:MAG TPA: hypothetical protein VMT10_00745, partial [Solirubrobacteraceae bacterium]|nr:hypothetical protein [Solirubrobacteraceae bacterium]
MTPRPLRAISRAIATLLAASLALAALGGSAAAAPCPGADPCPYLAPATGLGIQGSDLFSTVYDVATVANPPLVTSPALVI